MCLSPASTSKVREKLREKQLEDRPTDRLMYCIRAQCTRVVNIGHQSQCRGDPNNRKIHHMVFCVWDSGVLTALPTCEWSFSSPGTPWLRRSELPCTAAPQHSPPAGYTHAGNPTGSHRSWTQWWCRKEVPVCTPLGTNIKFTMSASEYQWTVRFCPLGQFIPPEGGNVGLTERMSSAWNWLMEKFNFLVGALAS